jgi:hypothetical protein
VLHLGRFENEAKGAEPSIPVPDQVTPTYDTDSMGSELALLARTLIVGWVVLMCML